MQYIPLFYYPLAMAMLLFLIATSSMTKREKVQMPNVIALLVLLSMTQELKADLMDFKLLDQAAQSYEAKDYNRSQLLYGDYAERTKDAEAYYNQANAYYKQGDFKNAQKMYKKVFSDSEDLKQKVLHNLGNSYAKEGSKESLEQAVQSYEKALKVKDDKETLENLEHVKEALEKLKQQEQEQDDKQEEGDKKNEEEQEKKDKQKSKKDSKEKDGDDKKKGDEKSKEKSDKKSDKNSDEEQKKKEQQEQEKSEEEQSQKSDKTKEEEKKEPSKAGATQSDKIMSDLEEQKWLKELNKNRAGHMYQLQRTENRNERTYEKPW